MAREFGTVERLKDGRTRICFWVSGRRYYVTSIRAQGGLSVKLTPELAEEALEIIRNAVRQGASKMQSVSPWIPGHGFFHLWEEFIESREAKGVSRSRLTELRGHVRRKHLEFFRDIRTTEISQAHLERYGDWLRKTYPHLKPKTLRNVLGDVVSGLRWMSERGWAVAPRMPDVPMTEYTPDIPSSRVLDAVHNEIPEERRGVFLARAHMGLRASEARRLDIADYDWREQRLTLGGSKTKTRRFRFLDVPPIVSSWLERWTPAERRLVGTAPLFMNPATGGRWHQSSERRVWLAACEIVGVKIKPNEGGRHYFATIKARGGAEIGSIQRYMGHADPRTTQRYVWLAGLPVPGDEQVTATGPRQNSDRPKTWPVST